MDVEIQTQDVLIAENTLLSRELADMRRALAQHVAVITKMQGEKVLLERKVVELQTQLDQPAATSEQS